ncbi:hypothetical protein PPL_01212 [Heterostelium album PN500]|uniref:Transmembrane protein n=1 Tax=Heterostelium pallidum (strain ATCC 26659 / Pp 5 / PN500) TaxID=670386 RepID=D3AYF2_HETP5|nr:hypothetical protein PPL_01212 [Heterostelium album PN500]EFA85979.1 hypothetical protein PPL_01212 [Heterostelium album PN500]|eukprot:XP_020438085.1 hypothetical protein PPL_01212 [Heterostelium album PN500]
MAFNFDNERLEKKKTILYASLIIFYAVSITLFMISELLKESKSCGNTSLFHSLLRADGIIDCIFLGVFLMVIIFHACSTPKPTSSEKHQKDAESAAELEKTDYSSKDNPFNYPETTNTPSPNNKPIPPTA